MPNSSSASVPDFPVLQQILLTYFPSEADKRPDRQPEFLALWGRYGEDRAEFEGLQAELRRALRAPAAAAAAVNDAFGLTGDAAFPPHEVRANLADLLDQLRGAGIYSDGDDTAPAAADTDDEVEPEDPDAVSYMRTVTIRGRAVPLWQPMAVGVAGTVTGRVLAMLPSPISVLGWLIFVVGVTIFLASAVTILSLRNEAFHPETDDDADTSPVRRWGFQRKASRRA